MKDFLTKKLLEEYLPDRSNFILMFGLAHDLLMSSPDSSMYCCWFDTVRKANEYAKHCKKVYNEFYTAGKARLLFDGERGGIYIAFDMSNGDKAGKRYCWLFGSKKAAQEHIKNQRANNGARLSAPHKITLL